MLLVYGRPAPDQVLRAADDEEALFSLSFALTSNGRKRTHQANELIARRVAAYLLAHFKQSNYVILKGPPRQGHSTPGTSGFRLSEGRVNRAVTPAP